MAHDVFISYASEDKTVADAVCAMIESQGVRCWIAPRDVLPGVAYGEAIIDAIHGSRIMVLIFSSKANASAHIPKEIERAASRGVAVLPFRIEAVSPGKSLDYFIGSVHWLDAFTPPLEGHVRRLAQNVQTLLTRGAPVVDQKPIDPVPVPIPAPTSTSVSIPPVAAAPPPPVPPAGQTQAGPSALLFAVLGLTAVIVIGLTLWLFLRPKTPAPPSQIAATSTPGAESKVVAPVAVKAPVPIGAQLYDQGIAAYKSQNFPSAANFWQQACDQGEPKGCAGVGVIFENGKGVTKDFNRALDSYKRACDGNYASGCYSLGLMYGNGRGVPKDEKRALDFYKSACDGSYAAGCTNAGVQYENGQGVKTDVKGASEFYERGCNAGSTRGCINLGILYETGRGVPKDKKRAADLYQHACSAGDNAGCQSLSDLNRHSHN